MEPRTRKFVNLLASANPEEISAIYFFHDLVKETRCPSFEHSLEAANVLLEEFSCTNKDLLSSLFLECLGRETTVLGNLRCYQKFLPTAQRRLNHLAGEKITQIVVSLIKPVIDNQSFCSKQQLLEFHVQQLAANEEALLIKMVKKLQRIRFYIQTETSRGKKDPRPADKEIGKFITRTKGTYLPLLASTLNKLPALTELSDSLRLIQKKIMAELPALEKISADCSAWYYLLKYDDKPEDLSYVFFLDRVMALASYRDKKDSSLIDGKPRLTDVNATFFEKLKKAATIQIEASYLIN